MKTNLDLNKIDPDRFSQKILALLNANKPEDFLFADLVTLVQKETEIESIGLRLEDGPDYPYYVTRGFSPDFVAKENFLCARDNNGSVIMDPHGLPKLECMCGNIIRGHTDPALPHFTRGGSFWTNNTTALFDKSSVIDLQGETRNRCVTEGYKSVAIIPVRDMETYGLLQLNDRRENLYTLQFIELMEWVASSIGSLVSFLHQHGNTGSIIDDLRRYQPSRVMGPIKSRD